MTMNLSCPLGRVKFVFTDGSTFQQVCIGDENYLRLTVPLASGLAFKVSPKASI